MCELTVFLPGGMQGQSQSSGSGGGGQGGDDKKDKKKKYEPPVPTRVGKKKRKMKGPDAANKLPLGEYYYFYFLRHLFILFIRKRTNTGSPQIFSFLSYCLHFDNST